MSGLVFGVIVIMWAVVLIPMWLRRHDETEETRSVDRFSQAMHTLSRRESKAREKKYGLIPTRTRNHEVHVSGASADGRKAPKRRAASSNAAAATAAERRRRTLSGLLAIAVATVMLAVFMGGMVLWGLQVVVDVTLLAFLMHLRNRARHAALIRPSRRPMARPAARYEAEWDDYADDEYEDEYESEGEEYFEPVPVKVQRPAQALFDQTALDEPVIEYAPSASSAGVFDQDLEPAQPAVATRHTPKYDATGRDLEIDIPIGEPAEQPKREVASGIGSRPWEPVPVPKPIYASKPAAPPRSRRAPMFDEPLLPPVETAAELDPADDLEEILDRRWAVND